MKARIPVILGVISLISASAFATVGENFMKAGIMLDAHGYFHYDHATTNLNLDIGGRSGFFLVDNLSPVLEIGYLGDRTNSVFTHGVEAGVGISYYFVPYPMRFTGPVHAAGLFLGFGLFRESPHWHFRETPKLALDYSLYLFVTQRIAPGISIRPFLQYLESRDIDFGADVRFSFSYFLPNQDKVLVPLRKRDGLE